MPVYTFNPLQDQRWTRFLEANPNASVFHTTAWLNTLRMTYGYEPVVYTNSPPGQELSDGIVLCKVESWITGRRLVSLPFSDYCEPLVTDHPSAEALLGAIREDARTHGWQYAELRPLAGVNGQARHFQVVDQYYLHRLDLSVSLDDLLHSFHKSSVQRKIKRADREGLTYREGRSDLLLRHFYRLFLLTRRRHQVPPQPITWYRNLIKCFGENLKIRVAYHGENPVASILTIRDKNSLIYKYGCSDPIYHNLGAMQFLFWKAIQDAKQSGLQVFDFGRSEIANDGLVTFKDHWGTTRTKLIYLKYTGLHSSRDWLDTNRASWTMQFARRICSVMPSRLLSAAGRFGYRHIG
jgi:CelD/BcsL family acetyltransferase involved in cellulose biosynthesis